MIKRVNVVDVGSVKKISDTYQRGDVCKDQVDNINFRDHEPIGAGYIAAWLKRCGFEAEIISPRSDVISLEEALSGNPQVVCFSSLTFNYLKTRELARKVKLAQPKIITIIGGYHAASVPQEVSREVIAGKPLFDFVVAGEGELSIDGIMQYLNGQLSQKDIGGVVYRDGKLWANKLYRFDPHLNPVPLRPKEKMLQSRRYGLYYPAPSQQSGVTLFVWSRGCPYNCRFCSSKRMFPCCPKQPPVLYRQIGDILQEIRFCQKKYKTNFGFSVDLNAPGTVRDRDHGKDWLRELCQAVSKTGLKWYAMCRLDVDPKCFEIMKAGGCTQIGFGVESLINPLKSQTNLSIGAWRQKARDVADQLRELKIMSKFYYIFGGIFNNQPETAEDIKAEGEQILAINCDTIRISWMTYPLYSPEFAQLKSLGQLEAGGQNYSLMSTEFPVIKVLGFTPEQLQILRTQIMADFFSPKRYGPHAKAQIARVPEWQQSFLEFDEILRRQFGQGWSGK